MWKSSQCFIDQSYNLVKNYNKNHHTYKTFNLELLKYWMGIWGSKDKLQDAISEGMLTNLNITMPFLRKRLSQTTSKQLQLL